MPTRDLDGDKLLYPYLQKDLLEDDIWLFQMLTARLVTALGVWPHPETYRRLPIVFPYAIRDETARGRKAGTEQWASPTAEGLLRDDNSLIKESMKPLAFESPRPHYAGRRIGRGKGWVAAHVWQMRKDGERASRHHGTNSFLANLVWLPKDLAQLSDRPGSFVQRYLQALSFKTYGHVEFPDDLGEIVAGVWDQLEVPEIPEQGLPEASALSFFEHSPSWIRKHRLKIERVAESLEAAAAGEVVPSGLRPTRYRDGLLALDGEATRPLRRLLRRYLEALPDQEP